MYRRDGRQKFSARFENIMYLWTVGILMQVERQRYDYTILKSTPTLYRHRILNITLIEGVYETQYWSL